ncbi:MAG: hypothetical protein JNM09_28030 [Blastocatellia bacterium]|nr:hypothetical protein [Blastocatellia bacterium]
MKKSKLVFSTFVLALTLLGTSLTSASVYADTYADNGDPQGAVNSTKAPPPPPPPPPTDTKDNPFAAFWDWFVSTLK